MFFILVHLWFIITALSPQSSCWERSLTLALPNAARRWSTLSSECCPVSVSNHTGSVLNYSSCSSPGSPTADAREETQVLPLSDCSLKRSTSLFSFPDVNEWANLIICLIHLKADRTSLHSWLLSRHSSALKWIMYQSLSSSLPESAVQLLHPVLACWFFTFPRSRVPQMPHPSICLQSHRYLYVTGLNMAPWGAHKLGRASNVKVPIY